MQFQSIGVALLFLAALAAIIRCAYLMSAAIRAERQQRELLYVTLRVITDGVITADADGRVTSINPEAQRITGWTSHEAVNRPLDEVLRLIDAETLAPATSPMARTFGEAAVAAKPTPTALVRKNGTVRDIEERVAPIHERGKITGCLVVLRDATDDRRLHKMMAHQLHASRLGASIIESSNDAIISHSLDGTIDSWNTAAEQLFGYPAAEIIGQPIALLSPRELHEEASYIARKIESGERIEHHVTQRVCADGRRVHVSLTISPVRNNDARIVGASIIARDVTRQMEADRRERDLLAESAWLSEELKVCERRKHEIVGELAQELLYRLAPVVTAAQSIHRDPSNAAAVGSSAQILLRHAEMTRLLIDDLLDITRVRQGKVELEKDRVDVAALIDEAAEAVRQNDCPALVIVSRPPQPVYVDADRARLKQVVANLLNNACKFTDASDEIFVSVKREPDAVSITVRDTGIGIAPEHMPHLFQMYSPERSSPRASGAHGIGLALVRSLVHLHGGTVAVDSSGLDSGSTFRVRLPA